MSVTSKTLISGFSLPVMERMACTIALHLIVLLAISLASAYVFLMLFNSKGINWYAASSNIVSPLKTLCWILHFPCSWEVLQWQPRPAFSSNRIQSQTDIEDHWFLLRICILLMKFSIHWWVILRQPKKHREWQPDYLFRYRLRVGCHLQSQTAGSAASCVTNHCDLQSLFKNLEQVNESKMCFKQLRTYSICGWKRITNEVILGPPGWFLKDILIQNRSNVIYNSSRLVYCL